MKEYEALVSNSRLEIDDGIIPLMAKKTDMTKTDKKQETELFLLLFSFICFFT